MIAATSAGGRVAGVVAGSTSAARREGIGKSGERDRLADFKTDDAMFMLVALLVDRPPPFAEALPKAVKANSRLSTGSMSACRV